jgi:hypothetical protein
MWYQHVRYNWFFCRADIPWSSCRMLNNCLAYQDNWGVDDIIELRYLEESWTIQNKQVGVRQNIKNVVGYEYQSKTNLTIVEYLAWVNRS